MLLQHYNIHTHSLTLNALGCAAPEAREERRVPLLIARTIIYTILFFVYSVCGACTDLIPIRFLHCYPLSPAAHGFNRELLRFYLESVVEIFF